MAGHVWLCQCLCPARHCIIAAAELADGADDAVATIEMPLRKALVEAIALGVLNPYCGLCSAGRSSWRYETTRTRYATMEAAIPELRALEERQYMTALGKASH